MEAYWYFPIVFVIPLVTVTVSTYDVPYLFSVTSGDSFTFFCIVSVAHSNP